MGQLWNREPGPDSCWTKQFSVLFPETVNALQNSLQFDLRAPSGVIAQLTEIRYVQRLIAGTDAVEFIFKTHSRKLSYFINQLQQRCGVPDSSAYVVDLSGGSADVRSYALESPQEVFHG